jgi:hypothetical protein
VTDKIEHLHGCARCGEAHEKVVFSEMRRPVKIAEEIIFTHWGECPTTGDPILLRYLPAEQRDRR